MRKQTLAETIVFDVDKSEKQILFTKLDDFVKTNKDMVFRKWLAISEYALMKDNQITKQNGKITYRKVKK